MLPDTLIPVKQINLKFTNKKISIPVHIQKKIDEHWEGLIKGGKNYTRGEVFSLENLKEKEGVVDAELSLSDYAHYLYSQNISLPFEHACKNIHTSCLIETQDGILVFGRMGHQTSRPGRIQCVGGGLDNDDLENGVIDLRHNIAKELQEEVGLNSKNRATVSNFKLQYLKYSPSINSVAAIFLLSLNMPIAEFKKHYKKFGTELAEKKELPEFGKLIYLKKEKTAVDEFCRHEKESLDHYMGALLGALV
jgi:hypothetical protein